MRFNQFVLRMLDGPFHRFLPRGLVAITYTAPVSGRTIRLPAQCVADRTRLLIVAGQPERKTWWRTFRHPYPAQLLYRGSRSNAVGRVLREPERSRALETYLGTYRGNRRGMQPSTPVIAFESLPQEGEARGPAP